MKKIRFLVFGLFFVSVTLVPLKSNAVFGIGENIALAKILFENIKQLIELKKIVKAGEDAFELVEIINARIDEALVLLDTINRAAKPGTFYKIKAIGDLTRIVEELYGSVPPSGRFSQTQKIHDLTVAESLEMHNDLFDYAKKLDETGEKMKAEANAASPGRAQKLVSQNQGALLQALAQLQRNQGQMIKLLAQSVAVQNQRDKTRARGHRYKYEGLKEGFQTLKGNYDLPKLK